VAGDSLRFLVIGDMGGLPTWPYKTPVEVGTADEMAKVAKQYSVQFILELGDNFYYDGVKNVEDKRFEVNIYIYNFCEVSPSYLYLCPSPCQSLSSFFLFPPSLYEHLCWCVC